MDPNTISQRILIKKTVDHRDVGRPGGRWENTFSVKKEHEAYLPVGDDKRAVVSVLN
jgi:hypothetical protein